jgi:tetratricopeptide (TPR) repeat protein
VDSIVWERVLELARRAEPAVLYRVNQSQSALPGSGLIFTAQPESSNISEDLRGPAEPSHPSWSFQSEHHWRHHPLPLEFLFLLRGHDRIRSWVRHNFACVLHVNGELDRAEGLLREAIALKQTALGRDHPDVAISLSSLSGVLEDRGHPQEALEVADRAIKIHEANGDPDSDMYALAQCKKGEALVALHRGSEAEEAFSKALRLLRAYGEPSGLELSFYLQGIGSAKLEQQAPGSAIPFLEDALRIRERSGPSWIYEYGVAESRFALARALWDSGRDRKRSISLAQEARRGFGSHKFPRREEAIVRWLAEHKPDLL